MTGESVNGTEFAQLKIETGTLRLEVDYLKEQVAAFQKFIREIAGKD